MIWIDNRAMTTIGLRPSRLSGFLTGARAPRARSGLAGFAGQLLGATQAAPEAVAEMEAYAPLATLADRPALAATIEAAYGGGVVRTIRTLDRPNVITRALLVEATITELPQAPGLTLARVIVTLRWLRVDGGSPDWPTPGPILLGTTRTAVPLGSLPSAGALLLFGYTSPLVITYTPANGVGATAWTITQALTTGEHVAADLESGDVFLATAAGGRSRVSSVTGTAPAMDPTDALGTLAPMLSLSSGTGLYLAARRYRL